MIPTGLYSDEDEVKRKHTAESERENIKELPQLGVLLLFGIFICDLFAAFSFPFIFQRKKNIAKRRILHIPTVICTRCVSVCFFVANKEMARANDVGRICAVSVRSKFFTTSLLLFPISRAMSRWKLDCGFSMCVTRLSHSWLQNQTRQMKKFNLTFLDDCQVQE